MRLTKRTWLLVLLAGLVVYVITYLALRFTPNPFFFSILLLLGASVVPASCLTFLLGRESRLTGNIHSFLSPVLVCLLLGGTIGVLTAGSAEHLMNNPDAIWFRVGVGPLEEFAKLIVPLVLFIAFRKRFRSQMHGLLFGVTTGVAFSILETMGYGLVALVNSSGNAAAINNGMFFHSLMSPANHIAWTGFIAALLWRERLRTGKPVTALVVAGFLTVAALHIGWNAVSSLDNLVAVVAGDLAIAAVSLLLVYLQLREAEQNEAPAMFRAMPRMVKVGSTAMKVAPAAVEVVPGTVEMASPAVSGSKRTVTFLVPYSRHEDLARKTQGS